MSIRALSCGPCGSASRGLERPAFAPAPVSRSGGARAVARRVVPSVCAPRGVCHVVRVPAVSRQAGLALATARKSSYASATASTSSSASASASAASSSEGHSSVEDGDTGAVDVSLDGEAALAALPDAPGVYGVFSRDGVLQYIGMSRRLRASVSAHARNGCREEMGLVEYLQVWGKVTGACGGACTNSCGCSGKGGDEQGEESGKCHGEEEGQESSARAAADQETAADQKVSESHSADSSSPLASRAAASTEELTSAWRVWIERAIRVEGRVPPGNVRGSAEAARWTVRRHGRELRLTPGKGADKLTVPIDVLVSNALRSEAHPLIAFIKGTPAAPQCGFSARAVLALERACARAGRDAHYDAVDVLDERHNPGVREAIKRIGGWPTLPQVYLDGELLGGSNILEQLEATGELQKQVQEHFDKKRQSKHRASTTP